MNNLKWFTNRINKRIYRDKGTCKCKDCKEVAKNGLIINDEWHAEYLYDNQCEQGLKYYESNNK